MIPWHKVSGRNVREREQHLLRTRLELRDIQEVLHRHRAQIARHDHAIYGNVQ